MSVTGYRLPSSYSQVSGTWTTPANLYGAGNASITISAKNTTYELDGTNFGFSTAIVPDNAVIKRVDMQVARYESSSSSATLGARAVVSGTPLTDHTSTRTGSLLTDTYDITAERAWTPANLRDGTLTGRCRAIQGNTSSGRTYYFDFIQFQVTWDFDLAATALDALTGPALDAPALGQVHVLANADALAPANGPALGTPVLSQNAIALPDATALGNHNYIANNRMQGAVVGTPGTLPSGWAAFYNPDGIAIDIAAVGQEDGIDYIDFRFHGNVATGQGWTSANISDYTGEAGGYITAAQGEKFNASAYFRLVAGSMTNCAAQCGAAILNSVGGWLQTIQTDNLHPSGAALSTQRSNVGGSATEAATAHAVFEFGVSYPLATAVDFTLRFGWPQIERGLYASNPQATPRADAMLGAPALAINLPAATALDAIAGPALDAPIFHEINALAANAFETSAPALDTPIASQNAIAIPDATPLATGAPDLGAPILVAVVACTALELATGAIALGQPALGQIHALANASALATSAPALDLAVLARIINAEAQSLTSGAPSLGSPALVAYATCTALDLAPGAPALGAPTIAQKHAILADALASGSPALDLAVLARIINAEAQSLAIGSPGLDAPTLGQKHALADAVALETSAPVLGTPLCLKYGDLGGDPLEPASPVLGTPVLAQVHALAVDAFAGVAPALGAPTIAQKHAILADALASGSPALDQPAISQSQGIAPSSLTTSAPVLDLPSIGQAHALAGLPLETSAPVLDEPTLARPGDLFGQALATSAPALGAPTLAQAHRLIGLVFFAGSPEIGAPLIASMLVLHASALEGGQPIISLAILRERSSPPRRPSPPRKTQWNRSRSILRTSQASARVIPSGPDNE